MDLNVKIKTLYLAASSVTSLLLASFNTSFASDFNLPFVNVAGLGVVYADWATAASDASTAYTNPAGLVNIHSKQMVFAPMGLLGNTRFKGTTITPSFPFPLTLTQNGSASSHLSAFMPSFYYAAPYKDKFVFGFGVTAPFALGTNYGKDSIVRYTSTRSKVLAIDAGPSVGFKVADNFSLGFGADLIKMSFSLQSMFGPPLSIPDSDNQNNLNGWGYGWHAGLLYQIQPEARLGLSFNSRVQVHTSGDSKTYTPFGRFKTNDQKSNGALPARAQLSFQYDITKQWTVMATAFYTNWQTFEKITMQRVMLPNGMTTSVTIPFNYHNTFDYSVGANFKPNEKWILRAGIQWMATPSNNHDRGVADPIGSAIVAGIGVHYEQNLCFNYDFGFGHSFFKRMPVHLNTPLTIDEGNNTTQTSVFGAQINWNML